MSGNKPLAKLDKNAVLGLCNSLNAWGGAIRPQLPTLAEHLRQAQETITLLYEENRALKGEKE